MRRVLQAVAVLTVVGLSAPAYACSRHGGGSVAIALGEFFFGFGLGRPCNAPIVVQPAPVVVAPPPVYAPPPVVMAPPPVAYVAPPPVVYVPTPPPVVVAPPPPPMVAAPTPPPAPVAAANVSVRVQRPVDPAPAHLGLKYLGGGAALLDWSDDVNLTGLGYSHSIGLEGRLTRWFALRSDLEWRPDGRSFDLIGAKLWTPTRTFKPFISASLSMSESYALPGVKHWGVVGAAGLDIWLGKHFFLSAEARYRVSPGDCCRSEPHLTGLVGAGFALF